MTPVGLLLAGIVLVVTAVQQNHLPIEKEQILAVATRQTLSQEALFDALARQRVVLVGESHDHPEHHRIQLETIRALRAKHGELAVGMEMFPAARQEILERWNAGKLEEAEFLDEIQWYDVWGFDPELYMPILRYLRQEKIPVLGLNAERELVRTIRMKGLEGLEAEKRDKLPPRAPATPEYLEMLREILDSHPEVMRMIPFERFVEAQQTWDSVMADGVVAWLEKHPDGVMVVLAGSGHVQKEGIPFQLRHRGVTELGALLPWSVEGSWLRVGTAEYAWGTGSAPETPPPVVLGVQLSPGMGHGHGHGHGEKKEEKKAEEKPEPGVKVYEVTPDSPAQKGGILAGDRILAIDGQPVRVRHGVVRLVRALSWNRTVAVKVWREGKEVSLTLTLPEAPQEEDS